MAEGESPRQIAIRLLRRITQAHNRVPGSDLHLMDLLGAIRRWAERGIFTSENPLREALSKPGTLCILLIPEPEPRSEDVALASVFLNAFLDAATMIRLKHMAGEGEGLPKGLFLIVDDAGILTQHAIPEARALIKAILEHILLRKGRGLEILRMYIGQEEADFVGDKTSYDYTLRTMRMRPLRTVSYTHLTLPTKRIV